MILNKIVYIIAFGVYAVGYATFQSNFILFKDSKLGIEKLLEIWNNLTGEDKNIFLLKLFEENPTPILSSPKYCTHILNIFVFLSCEIIEKKS